MLLKLLFAMAVCQHGHGAAGEHLLDVLAGVRGGNRVSLCMGPRARGQGGQGGPARCLGALWRSQWVVARASCLDHQLLSKVLVLRDGLGVSCYDLEMNRDTSQAKTIQFRFVHPEYQQTARGDLALLGLTSRYWHLDRLANTSSGNNLLTEMEPWMEEMFHKYSLDPRRRDHTHKSYLLSTPIRMFITTIIVPFVSFILFFLFVIFFTGSKDQIPYKSIEYEKFEENEKADKNDENEEYEKYEKCEDSLLQV